jgi:beta-fructofuranosidase
MGAEGYADRFHPIAHWRLYAFGDIQRRDNGSAELEAKAAGILDWANAYALNQFYDPVCEQRTI